VCNGCSQRTESRQIAEYQAASQQPCADNVNETWMLLDQVAEKLRKLQMKIDENLPKVGISILRRLSFILIFW